MLVHLQVPELRGKLAELEASADSGGMSAMSVGLAAIEVDSCSFWRKIT